MNNINEIEIYNDGNKTIYDLYNIMRPDVNKTYTNIIHYDARFIIKEPYGAERKLLSITPSISAKPIVLRKMSVRDKLIEDYAIALENNTPGIRPLGFRKKELNVKAGTFVNGYYCANDRVGGICYCVSERQIQQSFVTGDIIFTISDILNKKEIKYLYKWKQKNGLARPAKSSKDDNITTVEHEKLNFCLDLWILPTFSNNCKSSSIIRIKDLDTYDKNGEPIYRDWKRIYKDSKTQNVIMELI